MERGDILAVRATIVAGILLGSRENRTAKIYISLLEIR